QKDFVDSLADRHKIADQKHAGHRLSIAHAVVGEIRHSIAIVRKQNSPLGCGPREYVGIGSRAQSNVLNAHHIQFGATAKQPTQNVAVEVLIAYQLEHAPPPWPWRGPARSRAGCPETPATPRSCGGSSRRRPHIVADRLQTERGPPGSG